MMGSYIVLILFAVLFEGVFGDTDEVMEGDPFILNTGVTKQEDDIVLWYFEDTRIALINGHPNTSCVYEGKGRRFRGRLEVHCETGSLNIRDITTEHAGRYEAEIIIRDSSGQTQSLNIIPKCDGTQIIPKMGNFGKIIKSFNLTVSASKTDKNEEEPQKAPQNQKIDRSPSSGAVVGIVVGVVLLVAAAVGGVKIYRHRSSRNDMKKNKQVSKDEKQNEERHII